ncbi:MAG TPA: ferredoxin [Nitrospiraceae bacterium]|nr:ferredoxin [Nitrospiraceae bacterium]
MEYWISDRCTGCGTCQDVCPTEAIQLEDGRAVITMDCIDCGSCIRFCPEGAIRMSVPATVAPDSS